MPFPGPMEEAMTTFTFRSMTLAASLTALIAASASAGAQQTYKHHKAHAEYTALVSEPAPAMATFSHGRGLATEWDCGGGDAGCSWEPHDWRGTGE